MSTLGFPASLVIWHSDKLSVPFPPPRVLQTRPPRVIQMLPQPAVGTRLIPFQNRWLSRATGLPSGPPCPAHIQGVPTSAPSLSRVDCGLACLLQVSRGGSSGVALWLRVTVCWVQGAPDPSPRPHGAYNLVRDTRHAGWGNHAGCTCKGQVQSLPAGT